MELYTETSYALSRELTLRYSTSFSKSSELFSKNIRPHIFAIYGLVRIADEIVDTYRGKDAGTLLNELEADTYMAIKTQYSTNPIIHSFAQTSKQFNIPKTLIKPFFESMRTDLVKKTFTPEQYAAYIYGSAEVIGLMCLKVFVNGDEAEYKKLEKPARHLGAAYQKVNFLRDIKSDYQERGRLYFPGLAFAFFNDEVKNEIIKNIETDFELAKPALKQLPAGARKAVSLSYEYYKALLNELSRSSADTIKAHRIRISDAKKVKILLRHKLKRSAP